MLHGFRSTQNGNLATNASLFILFLSLLENRVFQQVVYPVYWLNCEQDKKTDSNKDKDDQTFT